MPGPGFCKDTPSEHSDNASPINPHHSDTKNTARNSSRTSLRLTTLNVKNVKSNLVFVQDLLKNCDICCIQEHWLFQFQLPQLNDIDENFISHAKGVDYSDPISPYKYREATEVMLS
ncbi:hypothetical protein DPMN_079072 [Dreissena polymorpha]|uniref:Endonuclease/exonuclease/phosphatase domain-containing protein n=1 Tax=Dreissena polymorpha TaxID=45954 RepID=A0A9D3YNE5_DREPO|nr:hypothetical protein DPMN_079072 [Dreissena polymorpha]